MPELDFHTHNLSAAPGTAIVNLPLEWTCAPELFRPAPGGCYSAGIHPWWTADEALAAAAFRGLERLLPHPQVVALGECGIDRLRGGELARQIVWLGRQVELAERYRLPVTLHCVRAFDVLLALRKRWRPTTRWTVHGFRGRPALARQLLDAGLDLSFGRLRNAESFALTPPERRHCETDDETTPSPDRPSGQ